MPNHFITPLVKIVDIKTINNETERQFGTHNLRFRSKPLRISNRNRRIVPVTRRLYIYPVVKFIKLSSVLIYSGIRIEL